MSKIEEESNGYLRQGEFRRWAGSVDQSLADLKKAVDDHGKALAVTEFRQAREDEERKDRVQLTRGVIGSVIGSVFALAIEAWHLFIHK